MALDKKAVVTSKDGHKDQDGKKKGGSKLLAPFRAIGSYFIGAWREIRQVRWPNRKATWSLTLAVLLFTAFWAVVILLLDLLFQFIFNNVILK